MDKQTEHPVPGENNSPDDLTPGRLMEQKNLNKRLVATARSLKKQKRKLKTAEDALRIRWSKVRSTADKYGSSRRTKSYPKRKLLPEFDKEALEPPQSKRKKPPGRIDDQMTGQEQQGVPHTSWHTISIKILGQRTTQSDLFMGQKRRLQEAT